MLGRGVNKFMGESCISFRCIALNCSVGECGEARPEPMDQKPFLIPLIFCITIPVKGS